MENRIGQMIKNKRKSRSLSADELAKMVGVNRATIYRYENGDIWKMPAAVLIPLAKALGLQPTDLLPGRESDALHVPSHEYPIVTDGISAGNLMNVDSISRFPVTALPDKFLGKYAGDKTIVLFKTDGESMNRIIPNGSIVAVKTGMNTDSLVNGDIVIFGTHGEYAIKRFYNDSSNRRFVFSPDSTDPSFLPIVVSYENSMNYQIVGKVVMYSTLL